MTKEQVNKYLQDDIFQQQEGIPELVETHISWVIIGRRFVYKIKKPVRFSFLDFSTLEKREYYCRREVGLNRRLTDDIYLDVQPVKLFDDIIDYAVRMRKVDRSRQMDILLRSKQVSQTDIRRLAEKMAAFHLQATIVVDKHWEGMKYEFNDLEKEKEFLKRQLGADRGKLIAASVEASDKYLERRTALLVHRFNEGLCRDVHGDLHAGNIFLLSDPQPFDCIEFNDEFRRIDVLNEIAFLCMDLEAFGEKTLSDLFLVTYNNLFPAIRNEDDQQLFLYYKSYRANVRAKVKSLEAGFATDDALKARSLAEADRYLNMMDHYLKRLVF